ncbi:TerC family protein [Tenuibacillus multivorans]|uniref:Integral membrane protein, YjbE family n=1 Tax=Tenuibacillus multivorans TaxID=237069 RepID=A0A1H0EHV5_9BACI|nr:TerC family protein [Tenuibacillus multivorans]GEL77153.1 putative membrane protein YjbE [Tenuibacillus multivorans]SDN81881.1 integral membrane protein, YjbE family [Tenuibacillus multivorans]
MELVLLDLNWDLLKAILIIIGLDLILGGDNAVVIAMASRNLPRHGQNKAIVLGTSLAILMRVCLASVVIFLLTIPYIQLIGGLFLFYIALKLLIEQEDDRQVDSASTLYGAVKTIVIADFIMSLDNVLAIAAVSNQNLILIVIGLAISVPIIIFGSKIILRIMNKYPIIVYAGASLIAYTSADLILREERMEHYFSYIPNEHLLLPSISILIVCLLGYSYNQRIKN